jgi:glycosyltransferase involved in cell wall biosynthesis
MRILIILPSGLVGGAERVAFSFAEHLLARGHEVTVYILTRGPGPLWPGLEGRRGFRLLGPEVSTERAALLRLPLDILRLRASGRFDLVYTSHVHCNALASLCVCLGLLRAGRLVARESTRIFERFHGLRRFVYRQFYRAYGRLDLLILQSADMRDSLLANIRLARRTRPVVLLNPVNLETIDRERAKVLVDRQAGWGEGSFKIVYCGRLIAVKRLSLLLQGLAAVPDPAWTLTILGDGPLRKALEGERDRLGLSDRVAFLGNVANPYQHFVRADLGVLVSEIEGFPNVLLEMMASGTRALVSTPCASGIHDLPGVDILDPATADGLAARIAQIINEHPDRRALYRRYVEDHRSIGSFAGRLGALVGLEL